MHVTMQGGRHTTNVSGSAGPGSNLCLAIFVLFINPVFGLLAVIFAVWSRMTATMDWEGARVKGKVSMFLSIAGIVITIIAGVIFIMIFYTKDS